MRYEQRPPPADTNGHLSPDSGAVSMSPGLESSEGHVQLEEVSEDDGRNTPPPIDQGAQQRGRLNSGGNSHSTVREPAVDEIADYRPPVPPKRVAFCDLPQPPHPSSQCDRFSHSSQPGFHRSYTISGNDLQQAFIPPSRIQRTQTGGYERSIPPSHQYPPNYRGHQFSHNPATHPSMHHPPPPPPPPPPPRAAPFSFTADHHRLPRVHRGFVGYENVLPHHSALMNMMSAGMPPHHCHSQPTGFRLYSAFSARQQSQKSPTINGTNRKDRMLFCIIIIIITGMCMVSYHKPMKWILEVPITCVCVLG